MKRDRLPLRVGIIGYGGFGRFLHRAWSRVDDVLVSHIVDSRTLHVPPDVEFLDSWEDLFEKKEVDLVSIATPPASHAEIACAALANDLHALIEKPIATTIEDATRIVEAARSSQASATVNFMLRFNVIVSCIHRWCRNGVFGSLQRVVVENYAQDESLGPDHWFWDASQSGGILVEHSVHFFDIVNAATRARPVKVTTRSWKRPSGLRDRVFALVEYDDGLVASHYHAFNRLVDFEQTSIRFVFDSAQVETFGWIPISGRILALGNSETLSVLNELPNLNQLVEEPVGASRNTPLRDPQTSHQKVDRILAASFSVGMSKEDAYLASLRALMSDFVETTRNPEHVPAVRLDDGLNALETALGQPS
jgi:predicted dehydrogenase